MRLLIPFLPVALNAELVYDLDLPRTVGIALCRHETGVELHLDCWDRTFILWADTAAAADMPSQPTGRS